MFSLFFRWREESAVHMPPDRIGPGILQGPVQSEMTVTTLHLSANGSIEEKMSIEQFSVSTTAHITNFI